MEIHVDPACSADNTSLHLAGAPAGLFTPLAGPDFKSLALVTNLFEQWLRPQIEQAEMYHAIKAALGQDISARSGKAGLVLKLCETDCLKSECISARYLLCIGLIIDFVPTIEKHSANTFQPVE